jgi:hypothetical protein
LWPITVLYRRENNSKVFIATPLIYPSHNLGYNNAELEHFLSFHLSSLLLAFDKWNPPGFFFYRIGPFRVSDLLAYFTKKFLA